jgi:ABC-type sugar transport system ATPase subunit
MVRRTPRVRRRRAERGAQEHPRASDRRIAAAKDGSLFFDGVHVPFGRQDTAGDFGVRLVPHEKSLVESMSVVPNISLGDELRAGPFVRRRELRQQARTALNTGGLQVALSAPARSLSLAEKRLVMVAKALSGRLRMLILDEPTAAMSEVEAARVLEAIARLRESGVTCVLITPRFDEVVAVCDAVVGVRDGRAESCWTRSEAGLRSPTWSSSSRLARIASRLPVAPTLRAS